MSNHTKSTTKVILRAYEPELEIVERFEGGSLSRPVYELSCKDEAGELVEVPRSENLGRLLNLVKFILWDPSEDDVENG